MFLDAELDDRQRHAIADALIASRYSADELERVLWEEVCPALYANLVSPAGQWSGFRADEVEQRILARPAGACRRWWSYAVAGRLVRPEWARVKDEFLRRAASRDAPSRTGAQAMHIRPATPDDRDALVDVWLRSARATHHFVTEADLQSMLPVVRDVALAQLQVWVLTCDGRPAGFLGMSSPDKMEALFVAPEFQRRGGGRMLVEHARALRSQRTPGTPLSVDVNEQNPDARRFYESMGFAVVGRSPTDDAGRPFPLLHMRETGGTG